MHNKNHYVNIFLQSIADRMLCFIRKACAEPNCTILDLVFSNGIVLTNRMSIVSAIFLYISGIKVKYEILTLHV